MPQFFRITFTGILYSQTFFENVVHFENTGPDLLDVEVQIEMALGWCTILAQGMVDTAGWRNIRIEHINDNRPTTNWPIVVNGIDGVGRNEVQPAVAIVWRLHTLTAGRPGKGRIYLCGYRNQLFTNGQLNQTGINNMNARLNAIKARYIVGGSSAFRLCVAPRNATHEDFKLVQDISMNLIPGCQRRRNIGQGI